MASQSLAMGEAFGKGFQFGKRRISAMTNEDFNKFSAKQMHTETTAEIQSMIPNMKQSMDNFSMLQTDIIKELISYAQKLPKDVLQQLGPESLATKALGTGVTAEDVAESIASLLGIDTTGSGIPFQDVEARRGDRQTTGAEPPPPPPPIILTPAQLFAISKAGQTVGPQITPAQQAKNTQVANQADNTIVITADGQIINKDVRKPVVLSTPPRSQMTQYGKYASELQSLTYIFTRSRWSVSDQRYIDNRNRYKTVLNLMRTLWNKYDFRSVNVVKKH